MYQFMTCLFAISTETLHLELLLISSVWVFRIYL